MRVLVTGAASRLAQAMLPALCSRPAVEAVTGIDSNSVRFRHAKFRGVALDIRDATPGPMLAQHDALVHLAFAVAADGMTADDMFDLNVRSAHKLFHAARDAGVKRLVHMSSAFVYGAAVHANEHSPLKPLSGFVYAEQQAQLDHMLGIEFPECVRLRPHVIVGPHAHPVLRKLLRQPFYLRLPDPQPLFQCVHEDDVAQAVLLALESEARGAYNLASEESLSLREAMKARHWLSVGLAPASARRGLELAARVLKWNFDPVWLERLSHTLLINSRRAISELGWRSRYSARAAIRAT